MEEFKTFNNSKADVEKAQSVLEKAKQLENEQLKKGAKWIKVGKTYQLKK